MCAQSFYLTTIKVDKKLIAKIVSKNVMVHKNYKETKPIQDIVSQSFHA